MNGTLATEFLATLNTSPCFAGHCDWRIPNARELESLTDYEQADPALPAPFNANCQPGCTGLTCGCPPPGVAWSSTTAGGASFALRAGESIPAGNAAVDATTMNAAVVGDLSAAGKMERWPKPLGSFALAVRDAR